MCNQNWWYSSQEVEHGSIIKDDLQVGGKSLKSFKDWNFLGQKFFTIALSLKDIELGLKSPMESFPSINLQSVAGWEYACLSQILI